MGDKSGVSSQVISLPRGGGALEGIGETFSPDLFTGTGNLTVPLPLPPGRTATRPHDHRSPSSPARFRWPCAHQLRNSGSRSGRYRRVFMEANVVRRGRRPGRYRSDAIPAAGLLGERGSLN
jgi:hypothetical protein